MSSRNPSRDGSLEPPDTRILSDADDDVGDRMASQRTRKATANQELLKRFRALKREYLARQREKSAAVLASTKAALESYLVQRVRNAEAAARTSIPIPKMGDPQTDTPGSLGPLPTATSSLPPSVLRLPLSDRKVSVKPSVSAQPMRSYVRIPPAVQPPPSYTTWSYLKRNELARDHGRRMFLVDEVGETVPADDGETEERLPWEDVDGAAVDWAMTRLAEEYGWDDPDVLEALMDVLRPQPQPEAIAQRLDYLQRFRLVDEDRRQMEVEEVLDAFIGSFCRRCRTYGCHTHGGGHVKPHHRPAPPPHDASGVPCGPHCWRTAATTAAAAAAAGEGPSGPNHANDGALEAPEAAASAGAGTTAAQDSLRQRQQHGAPGDGGQRPQPHAVGTEDLSGPTGTPAAGTAQGIKDAVAALHIGDDMDVDGSAGPSGQLQHLQGGGTAASTGVAAGEGPAGEGRGEAAGGGGGSSVWSPYELSLVRQGIQVFGRGNPCMVALLLPKSRTCAQVKTVMDRIGTGRQAGTATAGGQRWKHQTGVDGVATAAAAAEGPGAGAGGAPLGSGAGAADAGVGVGSGAAAFDAGDGDAQGLSRVPARRKGGRAKKTVFTNSKSARSLVVNARAQHGTNNDWHEYQPCTCMGNCKADCPCVRAHNFCEKFCACSPTCRERFRGCTCKSVCTTNQCACWAAGRECDPDLCNGCAPTLEGRVELGRECHNMRLRMRQHAHVVLGTSDIPGAGWGLFAAQYVAKNGFLGEYTGDLITQDEANRRGSVYDQMNNSYLFNLNKEWVVDAKFRGNKLRCANHSHEPVAKAKVLLVDGESRIAILADKHITPGMEITYDYRYSDDTAPHWVKKKQQRG